MLVLSRLEGEIIEIGDSITIQVIEVRYPKKVRLGIVAPKDVPVHRKEIADLLRANKSQGSQDSNPI